MAFDIFKKALKKTRELLSTRVEDIFVPGKTLETKDLDLLEEALIAADVGMDATEDIIEHMKVAAREQKIPAEGVLALLEDEVRKMVAAIPKRGLWDISANPHVILLVGVNGTGKTTCAGKLAKILVGKGKRPLLAASDTFRAAANEQLTIWAERAGVEIVQSASGADPASVAFDAVKKALTGKFDAVIIDTAGRLHTKVNLMEELKKVHRVCGKAFEGAPHDVLLVLDATTGNNGLAQAKLFSEAVGITGIILTKLDSSAKGGIALAIMRELKVPVLFVGVGEALDDLVEFDPDSFITGLFEA
jgi:fused signal recognition particle receptor